MCVHHSGAVGGAGASLVNNVAMLSENNDVTVYIPSDPDFVEKLMVSTCPKAHVVKYGRRIGAITCYSGGDRFLNMRFIYRMLLIIKQFLYWNHEIDRNSPDVILINSKILCWMSILPSVKKRKSIIFVRETMQGSPNRPINKIISYLLDKFSTVVFISEYDKNIENLTTAKTIVIKNSINPKQLHEGITRTQAVQALNLHNDTFNVLYVGGVSEMKGFDIAVQAVLKTGVESNLLVAGNDFNQAMQTKSRYDRQYTIRWKKYIEEEDKYHQIKILGRQADMTYLYAACDVLLFPMRSAHQARPVFEAGYYKKPVIITKFNNISEFVTDGDNGFTINHESVDDVTNKLLQLINNKNLAEKMGLRNYSLTIQNHDVTTNYRKLCQTIEDTINL